MENKGQNIPPPPPEKKYLYGFFYIVIFWIGLFYHHVPPRFDKAQDIYTARGVQKTESRSRIIFDAPYQCDNSYVLADNSSILEPLETVWARFDSFDVFLLGDSTLRNKLEYLRLHVKAPQCSNYSPQLPCYNITSHLVQVYYAGVSRSRDLVQTILKLMPTWLASTKNLIIIFNVGLHELHLFPARPTVPNIHMERELREAWRMLEAVSQTRRKQTITAFKLTNAICRTKFTNEYASSLAHWHNGNSSMQRNGCKHAVQLEDMEIPNLSTGRARQWYLII